MDKALIIALLPAVTLVLILGWVALMVFGKKRIHLTLKGLGVDINLRAYQEGSNDVQEDRKETQ